jgi:hypothetical protein
MENYIEKDGIKYKLVPVKESIKKTQIKPNQLEDVLQKMSAKKVKQIFGKLNKESGYPDSKNIRNFWNFYELVSSNDKPVRASIKKRYQRLYIVPKQLGKNATKKTVKQVLNAMRKTNYAKIKVWQERNNKWAVESLARENALIGEQIAKL